MTLIASLSSVHCALPNAQNIAGSSDSFVAKESKVVVVGGSDHACFVAKGLAAMGASVSIVSTGDPSIDDYRVQSFSPAVGDLEVGFAAHLGEFDSLVDTISDESSLSEAPIWDDEDDLLFGDSDTGVITLLKTIHKCDRYISTMTASQRIIRDNGVFFGPGQAKDHVKKAGNDKSTTNIIPPKGFGETVQTLLENGITYSWKSEGSKLIRSWSLPEFWELTSWPRDAAASANVRFGFPVVDDLEVLQKAEEEEEEETGGKEQNPFVVEVSGVGGLSREIVEQEKDCLLFLSASFCRTCKTISPAYTRFARMNQSEDLMFAKADTGGKVGKELGRALEVNAVPLFIFFKGGERFGTPLSINKLPSKKLDMALDFLTSGSDWDGEAINKVKEKNERRRK